jgi:hypothetical protein
MLQCSITAGSQEAAFVMRSGKNECFVDCWSLCRNPMSCKSGIVLKIAHFWVLISFSIWFRNSTWHGRQSHYFASLLDRMECTIYCCLKAVFDCLSSTNNIKIWCCFLGNRRIFEFEIKAWKLPILTHGPLFIFL